MTVEIKAPSFGESVTEGTVSEWKRRVGDAVRVDEVLVLLETEKIALEVVSPSDGILSEILADDGCTIAAQALLGRIRKASALAASQGVDVSKVEDQRSIVQLPVTPPIGAGTEILLESDVSAGHSRLPTPVRSEASVRAEMPSRSAERERRGSPARPPAHSDPALPQVEKSSRADKEASSREERVPMTRLRRTIARRLKEAQTTAAILTTFNEIDMSAILSIRTQYQEAFRSQHLVKLGFMSFFVKAAVDALKAVPQINAHIDGNDIVYNKYFDICVAVGTDRGLVTPVIRDADRLSIAEIEKTLLGLSERARAGELTMKELQGGTFTISNGGSYGSLLSTPILNSPQSGILGMHKIQPRPMVVGSQILARPMMYLALSYDHRLVDGREAVGFLVKIKEPLEDPRRLLLAL